MIPLADLNTATREDFIARLGAIFEHSPWIAELAYARRPFTTRDALHSAMAAMMDQAGPERQLALLRAHPELAGSAAVRGTIAEFSSHEQGASGLLDCSPEELAQMETLNRAYAAKFGFPFIIAVRGLNRTAIVEALARRLGSTPEAERAEALRQVARIAARRLADTVEEHA